MIKGLLKLDILIFTLFLAFISISCGNDSDSGVKKTSNGKELLEGKVKFGGSYSGSPSDDVSKASITFKQGNILNCNFEYTNGTKEVVVYKMSSLEEGIIEGDKAYHVQLKVTSDSLTPLTQTVAEQLNDASQFGYTDWKKGGAKNVTSYVNITQFVFAVSDDKSQIEYIFLTEGEPDNKIYLGNPLYYK